MKWQPMETAPKGHPILVYCDHRKAECYNEETGYMSVYGAHMDIVGDKVVGPKIAIWGGHIDEGCGEPYIPDWWFEDDDGEYEQPLWPIGWIDIPEFKEDEE